MTIDQIQPIFVLGVPRSGTTVIGNYLSSSLSVHDLGEYRGFFLAYALAPKAFARVPAPASARYLKSLAEHARDFAAAESRAAGCAWYCDQTPMNLLIAQKLTKAIPAALFILMIRHYSGVILSLARSYEDGFRWAGATLLERAQLYAHYYERVSLLPKNRTIALSYDRLCATPTETLSDFHMKLARLGFPVSELDSRIFTTSFATGARTRPTLGQDRGTRVVLRSMPSVDQGAWTDEIDGLVRPQVREAERLVDTSFPSVLYSPLETRCCE